MNEVAFFYHDRNIYWHSIIMVLAILVFIMCFWGLRILQKKKLMDVAVLTVVGIPIAMLLSRFTYCFFTAESRSDIVKGILAPNGGNSLVGVIICVIIMVPAARMVNLIDDMAEVFDCIAPAAAASIAVGRLSEYFGDEGRGIELSETAKHFITCTDQFGKNRVLAIFAYEAIFAAMIFIGLTFFFFMQYAIKNEKINARKGDTALLFLASFGTSQGVFESMRSDSITLIGLGFVRILQITALICLLVPAVVFSVRSVRRSGMSMQQVIVWLFMIGAIAASVYIEFIITADTQMKMHMVMAECMMCVMLLLILQYNMSNGRMYFLRNKK